MGWLRFYEYFAHPGDQKTAAGNAQYCANTIKNAAREASLGVPFVAAASDYPWGPGPQPSPSPGPPPPPPGPRPRPHPGPSPPPCAAFTSRAACPPRCLWDSGTCDPLPPPPPGTDECAAAACSSPGAQWGWAARQSGAGAAPVTSRALDGSPLRLGTWPNCDVAAVTNGTELAVGGGAAKSVCPPLSFALTEEGRLQLAVATGPRGRASPMGAGRAQQQQQVARAGSAAAVRYCLAIPAHATAKLFECGTGTTADDEQRFTWNGQAAGACTDGRV